MAISFTPFTFTVEQFNMTWSFIVGGSVYRDLLFAVSSMDWCRGKRTNRRPLVHNQCLGGASAIRIETKSLVVFSNPIKG